MLWRKIEGTGGASLRIGGKRREIQPGETFHAEPQEIPVAFQDTIRPVGPVPPPPEEQPPPPEATLEVVQTSKRGGGTYDVRNRATGKRLNARPLKKAEAEALVGNGTEPGEGN